MVERESVTTVVAFPGQGSQHPGMFVEAPENEALARLLDAAEALTGLDLRHLAAEGAPEALADTRVAQPLIYLIDWAWGSALLELGVEPDVVAGHSLGEFAACAVAGVFSVEAGLELVCTRARMMSEAAKKHPGTMAAVLGLDIAAVDDVLSGIDGAWVANDNVDGQVVISGTAEGVNAAVEALQEAGARRSVPLEVSGAFHTPLMGDAAAEFSALLAAAEFRSARIPVVQNTRPTPATEPDEIRTALMGQMAGRVRWRETLDYIATLTPVYLIEAGPGNVLRGLARRVEGIGSVSVEGADLESIIEGVGR